MSDPIQTPPTPPLSVKPKDDPTAAEAKTASGVASGYAGSATLGAGSGGAEATLLGATALNQIGAVFARRIWHDRPTGVKTVVLVAAQAVPDFQRLLAFEAQFDAMQSAFDRAVSLTAPSVSLRASVPAVVASLVTGLTSVSELLAFAKSEYVFQAIDIASSDAMLLSALAGRLKSCGFAVHVPALYGGTAAAVAANPARAKLSTIHEWRVTARQHVDALQPACDQVQKQVDAAALPTPLELMAQLTQARDAVAVWKAVADAIDSWLKQLTTADDKGTVPLAGVFDQAALRQRLGGGDAALIVVQLHKLAGTGFVKKNLLSSLGWNPFHVMGGALAGYVALHGESAQVFSSMLMPRHGGYHPVSDLWFEINRNPLNF